MFIEQPANKASISRRKPILGIGINDAPYKVQFVNGEGKSFNCPFYTVWTGMITRSYNKKYHQRKPTYKGCSVCKEWLTFSNFKAWIIKQDWNGKHLDKDILNQGNKHYSPENCVFVTDEINKIFSHNIKVKGDLPIGVKRSGKKFTSCYRNNHLGTFSTKEEASEAYRLHKISIIKNEAFKHSEPLRSAMLSHQV